MSSSALNRQINSALRRIAELEDLNRRADDRVVEVAEKIQQRSQEIYFLEKKLNSVKMELEAQKDVNNALEEKCVEDEEEQQDALEDKLYLLEEEMKKAEPIRDELIQLKGRRAPPFPSLCTSSSNSHAAKTLQARRIRLRRSSCSVSMS